jgi:adenylylsulfate kinase-like enzyme
VGKAAGIGVYLLSEAGLAALHSLVIVVSLHQVRGNTVSLRQAIAELDLTNVGDARLAVELVKLYAIEHEPRAMSLNSNLLGDRIRAAEQFIAGKSAAATLAGQHRTKFRLAYERLHLHADIVKTLFKKRRSVDGSVKLKRYGVRPSATPGKGTAIIVTGLPASGKSHFTNILAHEHHAFVVDPDDAKMMLPEYEGTTAHILHEESSQIAKGHCSLLSCMLNEGLSFVLPNVGADASKIKKLRDQLLQAEHPYMVALVHVRCRPEVAAARSLLRLMKDARYVPLRHIIDEVGTKPQRAYVDCSEDEEWHFVAEVNSCCRTGQRPLISHDRLSDKLAEALNGGWHVKGGEEEIGKGVEGDRIIEVKAVPHPDGRRISGGKEKGAEKAVSGIAENPGKGRKAALRP